MRKLIPIMVFALFCLLILMFFCVLFAEAQVRVPGPGILEPVIKVSAWAARAKDRVDAETQRAPVTTERLREIVAEEQAAEKTAQCPPVTFVSPPYDPVVFSASEVPGKQVVLLPGDEALPPLAQEFYNCIGHQDYFRADPEWLDKIQDGAIIKLYVEDLNAGALEFLFYLAKIHRLGAVVLSGYEDRGNGSLYRWQLSEMRRLEPIIKERIPGIQVGITVSMRWLYLDVWSAEAKGWQPDFLCVYGVSGYEANYERVARQFFPGQKLFLGEFVAPIDERYPVLVERLKALGYIGLVKF